MNQQLVEILKEHAVGPVIAGTIGAIGIGLRQLYQTRNLRYKLQQAYSDMVEKIDFIEKWLRVKQQACSPEEFDIVKRSVSRQLEEIYSARFESNALAEVATAGRSYLQNIRHTLLLFWPTGLGGWIAHLLFWLIMLIYFLFVAISISPGEPGSVDSNEVGIGFEIAFFVVVSLIFLVPAILMRAWALRIEKKNMITNGEGASGNARA